MKLKPCSNRCRAVVSLDVRDSGLDSAIIETAAQMTKGEEKSSETLDSIAQRRRGRTLPLKREDETCDD
ncbi:hypothetical protein CDL15_Pgr015148 [Punica granatum]|uniref:Uncharacterized protein n=1 Tax=Punica granatum TaxID=22663 RepID=A0A218VYT9_PUNGR|nr:hypothetical protein CDL15_Pgr015148 [Punica granatum]